MNLRRGQSGAAGIFHGLQHVGDQLANLRRRRVGHFGGPLGQDRVAHAGDVENGHGAYYGPPEQPGKAPGGRRPPPRPQGDASENL